MGLADSTDPTQVLGFEGGAEFAAKPGAGRDPMPIRTAGRDPLGRGRLVTDQPRKVARLDEYGRLKQRAEEQRQRVEVVRPAAAKAALGATG